MKILVLNCGSSSMKYQLMDMKDESVIAKGNYERIGQGGSFLTHKVGKEKYKYDNEVNTHAEALDLILKQLIDKEYGVIKSLSEIDGVGHRLVNGGERFKKSELIDEYVLKDLEAVINFAPLHNPGAISGIKACMELMPGTPNSVVVDTSFHQTIPEERYLFPVPYRFYEKYKLRKYGAHGTSHRYVTGRICEILNKKPEELKIINCHLGQGASLCAIENGKSVDTSMGFTPLGGIAMGSRSGDLDPSVVTFIMKKEGLNADEVEKLLNKESGLLGMSELSADNRDLLASIENGDEHSHRSEVAFKTYTYIIAQYIARYCVALNGVDVITFCGGVGERGPDERKMICDQLKWLGVELDEEANKVKAEEKIISTPNSKVQVWVVPTDEEVLIARDTVELINNK